MAARAKAREDAYKRRVRLLMEALLTLGADAPAILSTSSHFRTLRRSS
jgi:hypothetical protein